MQNREAKSEQVKTFLVSGAYRLLVTSLKKLFIARVTGKQSQNAFKVVFVSDLYFLSCHFEHYMTFSFSLEIYPPSLPRQKNHNVTLYKQIDS